MTRAPFLAGYQAAVWLWAGHVPSEGRGLSLWSWEGPALAGLLYEQEGATQAEYTDGLQPSDSQMFVPRGLVLFPTDLPSLGESHLFCLNPVFTSHFHPQGPKGIFPNLHDPELKGQ